MLNYYIIYLVKNLETVDANSNTYNDIDASSTLSVNKYSFIHILKYLLSNISIS